MRMIEELRRVKNRVNNRTMLLRKKNSVIVPDLAETSVGLNGENCPKVQRVDINEDTIKSEVVISYFSGGEEVSDSEAEELNWNEVDLLDDEMQQFVDLADEKPQIAEEFVDECTEYVVKTSEKEREKIKKEIATKDVQVKPRVSKPKSRNPRGFQVISHAQTIFLKHDFFSYRNVHM